MPRRSPPQAPSAAAATVAAATGDDVALTERLGRDWATVTAADVPGEALEVARHCVLDWLGCALAGSREPLTEILVREVVEREGPGPCTVIGRSGRTERASRRPATASARNAALVNGAAGHALDFDDTHLLLSGHPTAPVLPAALAVAEELDAPGEALLVALVVGIEVECRVGALLTPGHYAAGWHATGTIGTFGAAAATAHLLGLGADAFAHALALAATQASGLKASFGTMAKPLHAGVAATSGLLAARLAAGGFTGEPSIIEAPQGLARAAGGVAVDPGRLDALAGRWTVRDTLFKHHAACYLTHASINAARRVSVDVAPGEVDQVEVHVAASSLDVCGIPDPTTGLEAKFSLRATTAMALLGDDTTDAATYSDERALSRELVALRDRVVVVPDLDRAPTRSRVVVRTRSGATVEAEDDTSRPAADLARQWELLAAKATALTRPLLGDAAPALVDAVAGLASMPSVRALVALVA